MKIYFRILFYFIILTPIITAQNNKTPFNEKQLIEKSLLTKNKVYIPDKWTEGQASRTKTVPDSVIADILSAINPDSVKMFISGLQNLGTRYALAPNRDKVAEWIKQKYISMGFADVVIDSFLFNETWQKNIIATLPGKNNNEVCIIGGHYDSITYERPESTAPGADDNASGTTAALEIARVMKSKKFIPECTIKFINFAAEEFGLYGSKDLADKYLKTSLTLKLMINADMISYSSQPLFSSKVAINYYKGSESWLLMASQMVQKFSKLTPINGEINSYSSDSYTFWNKGFQVVYFSEDEFSPYYHSVADTIGNYNMPYCAEVIKSACAVLINACSAPAPIQNLKLFNTGDGISFLASWLKSKTSDFKSYKVYLGESLENFDTSFITTDTSITITAKNGNTQIYVAVSVLTNAGFESSLVNNSLYLTSIPPTPFLQFSDADKTNISFSWFIYDSAVIFSGYNFYRSDSLNGNFKKMNSTLLKETNYTEKPPQSGKYYYYSVKSVYSNGAESNFSYPVRARLATFDQGIGLFVTGTTGDGSYADTNKYKGTQFFINSLKEFSPVLQQNEEFFPNFSDLGAYSTIVWCNNSRAGNYYLRNSTDLIQKYLDRGGKILISTKSPALVFSYSEFEADTRQFQSGDFLYDYFKVGLREYPTNIETFFSEALPKTSGYPAMLVDTSKAPAESLYQLKEIESITPNAYGKAIYTYNSNSDTNPLKGKSVGIEYMGNDYKAILLSFPLYYMKEARVKEFLRYVLTNKFAEPLAAKEKTKEPLPEQYSLNQNYPNPFNPATTITYSLPVESKVKLIIYNSLGQQAAVLNDNIKPAGTYNVQFNANRLSSGVYFYSLFAEPLDASKKSFQSNRKMLLLK